MCSAFSVSGWTPMTPPSERPTTPVSTPDLELLRRYEPVIRYTKGEQFFPSDVERYVRACSLWAHHLSGRDELIVPQDYMNIRELVQERAESFGTVHYL